jgi:hypothetical protein
MARVALLALAATLSCVGTTGGEVVDFTAAAAGPTDAETLRDRGFVTDRGWHVVLTKAKVHVGALYLNESQPISGSQATECILPGTYVAQVPTGMDVDTLSSAPQRFPVPGHGTTLPALTGEVWLAGGASDHDFDQLSDATPVLLVEGTADRNGDVRPFAGQVTIAANRQVQGGLLAGANTICKQRLVSPIPTRLALQRTGGLLLRIDPRLLFVNVDFSQLAKFSERYGFSDDPSQIDPRSPLYYSQPSTNLYQNLHSGGAPGTPSLYAFTWESAL